jgi:hypothetical protein
MIMMMLLLTRRRIRLTMKMEEDDCDPLVVGEKETVGLCFVRCSVRVVQWEETERDRDCSEQRMRHTTTTEQSVGCQSCVAWWEHPELPKNI